MKTWAALITLAAIAAVTALALAGVVAGDDVLELLKLLIAGAAGGGAATIARRP